MIWKGVVLLKLYIFQQEFLPKVEKGGWHFIFPRKRKVQAFQKCKKLFSEMFRKKVALIFVKKIKYFFKLYRKITMKNFYKWFSLKPGKSGIWNFCEVKLLSSALKKSWVCWIPMKTWVFAHFWDFMPTVPSPPPDFQVNTRVIPSSIIRTTVVEHCIS